MRSTVHKEVSLRILLAKTNLVCPSYVMLGFCKKKFREVSSQCKSKHSYYSNLKNEIVGGLCF